MISARVTDVRSLRDRVSDLLAWTPTEAACRDAMRAVRPADGRYETLTADDLRAIADHLTAGRLS